MTILICQLKNLVSVTVSLLHPVEMKSGLSESVAEALPDKVDTVFILSLECFT